MYKLLATLAAAMLGACCSYAAASGSNKLGEYRFDYALSGSGDAVPLQVFSDGKRTFIQLKATVSSASFEDLENRNLFEAVKEGNLYVLPASVRRLQIRTAGAIATAVQSSIPDAPTGQASQTVQEPVQSPVAPAPIPATPEPLVIAAAGKTEEKLLESQHRSADKGEMQLATVLSPANERPVTPALPRPPVSDATATTPLSTQASPQLARNENDLRMDPETQIFEFDGLRGRRLSALLRTHARQQKWVDVLWDVPYDLVLDSEFKFVARSYPELLLKVLQPFGLSADLHNPNRLITVYETRGLSK